MSLPLIVELSSSEDSEPEVIIERQNAEKSGLSLSTVRSMSDSGYLLRTKTDCRKNSKQENC